MKIFILLLTVLSQMANASEEHVASIRELAWPAFNFSILFGIIIWKIRAPLRNVFNEKSKKVQELYRSAENKYKEAKARHDESVKKLKNVSEEAENIMHEANKEAEHMEIRIEEEIRERTERMWQDASHVLESEKKQKEIELNNEILETVILKTKKKVVEDKNVRSKATSKILESLK